MTFLARASHRRRISPHRGASTQGFVLTRTPGWGKTTLILQPVENSRFGRGQSMEEKSKGMSEQAVETTKELRELTSEVPLLPLLPD